MSTFAVDETVQLAAVVITVVSLLVRRWFLLARFLLRILVRVVVKRCPSADSAASRRSQKSMISFGVAAKGSNPWRVNRQGAK